MSNYKRAYDEQCRALGIEVSSVLGMTPSSIHFSVCLPFAYLFFLLLSASHSLLSPPLSFNLLFLLLSSPYFPFISFLLSIALLPHRVFFSFILLYLLLLCSYCPCRSLTKFRPYFLPLFGGRAQTCTLSLAV